MPLYFFDVIDDGQSIPDEYGVELNDLFEAREQAQALLPNIASERLPEKNRRDLSVTVRRADGRRFFTATLTIRGDWEDTVSFPLTTDFTRR